MQRMRASGPVTNPTARALSSWLCALWGRHEGAPGGPLVPRCGASRVGRSPTPHDPSLGRAAGARYPLAVSTGGGGMETGHQPHSARSCEVALRAEGAARGRQGGRRLLPWWGASGVWRSPRPHHPSLGHAVGAIYPVAHGARGVGVGTRHQPHSGFAHCGGCTTSPEGARLLPGCGASRVGRSPAPDRPSLERVDRAHYPEAVGAVCGRGGPTFLGTFSRAAVRRVLCALSRSAAAAGRCCSAPVLVPWLWPVTCLSGVPCGPVLVRCAMSGPVALGAPVGFAVAVVPPPTLGAVAPGLTGRLHGARGGGPGTGIIVPAAGPCQGRGAGLAPRCTRSGPRVEVVPGGSLRLRS